MGDGNLVKKINPNGSKTLYVGGIYEVDKASGGSVTRTVTYYPVAGAMRIDNTLYYVLKDHLGSASVITNNSGTIQGTQRYYPFGETRLTTGTIYTDKLFTGQREMAGLGIYHYQARFYSPKLGRFISPDTLIPGAANPQAFNRYSYVLNNPIRYNDPTGHVCSDPDDPSPSCESGNPYPNNTQPLPSGPIDPGGPLDPGLPQGGGDDNDGNIDQSSTAFQCTNILGQTGGCVPYFSVSLGLDAPTIMILFGAGLSLIKLPHIGLPIALAGGTFEACAFTATPLCAVVKLLSVNISGTIDGYGNLYVGPQLSWGKSVLPVIAVSNYTGIISSGSNTHVPTEVETRDHLSGIAMSTGSIASGGVTYSPFAETYNTSYYLVGVPEVFSVNFNYNFLVHDFSP